MPNLLGRYCGNDLIHVSPVLTCYVSQKASGFPCRQPLSKNIGAAAWGLSTGVGTRAMVIEVAGVAVVLYYIEAIDFTYNFEAFSSATLCYPHDHGWLWAM